MSSDATGRNRAIALERWGSGAPDWVLALADECDRTSQNRAGLRLGVTGSLINQVLRAAYKGRLDRIETRVRGELMRQTVACPVLGEISSRQCLDEQSRPRAATNPLRVALYQACRACPHNGGTHE